MCKSIFFSASTIFLHVPFLYHATNFYFLFTIWFACCCFESSGIYWSNGSALTICQVDLSRLLVSSIYLIELIISFERKFRKGVANILKNVGLAGLT